MRSLGPQTNITKTFTKAGDVIRISRYDNAEFGKLLDLILG